MNKGTVIVQARLGSVRFPRKVLRPFGPFDECALDFVFTRLANSSHVSQVILATTNREIDDELAAFAASNFPEVLVVRGPEEDVLARFILASADSVNETLVRITADCPLVDWKLLDDMLAEFWRRDLDYLSNTLEPTFPDGFDVEIFSKSALLQSANLALTEYEREHVTPVLKKDPQFTRFNFIREGNYSKYRVTLDYRSDLKILRAISRNFDLARQGSQGEICEFLDSNVDRTNLSQRRERDEGSAMDANQKMFARASEVIAGGNHLLSKHPNQFLPGRWPSYFSDSKGIRVTDLNGHEYLDFSMMGIGTNSLGYANPEVDSSVMKTLKSGNLTTLNCFEEVLFSEQLLEIHPWADQARLARTGGEINAVALRLARAHSGKDKVLVCGYHGWHDWYLAANIEGHGALDKLLLPGLSARGVPSGLSGSIGHFWFNDIESFDNAISEEVGVVFMEVMRNSRPDPEFLNHIREVTSQKGIILIFDECTSGFRENFGGLHLVYGVQPDMATFGKAIGNGYSLTALIGREEVMVEANHTFVSSTFWTDRIGPTAGIATLGVMRKLESWNLNVATGKRIRQYWLELANSYGLEVSAAGLYPLTTFTFKDFHVARKTFLTQEMLRRGYLFSTNVYPSTEHSEDLVSGYFDALNESFSVMMSFAPEDLESQIPGGLASVGFGRLN
jgi:glutamate-1-semialdehyde 2,1-aminomutase